MKFNLKQLMFISVLIAIMAGFYSAAVRVEVDQTFSAVAFSPSGRRVAVQGSRNCQIFDAETGRRLATIPYRGYDQFIRFVDEDQIMLTGYPRNGSGNAVVWYSIEDQALVRSETLEHANYLHFAPAIGGFLIQDGTTHSQKFYSNYASLIEPLYIRDFNNTVDYGYYHDRTFGLSEFNGTVEDFKRFDPSKTDSSSGRGISDWEVEWPDGEMKPLKHFSRQILLAPDGKSFLWELSDGLAVHNRDSGRRLWFNKLGKLTNSEFSADGRFVLTANYDSERDEAIVMVLDAESGKRIWTSDIVDCDPDGAIHGLPAAISSSGIAAISSSRKSGEGLKLIDISSGSQLFSLGITNSITYRIQIAFAFLALYLIWCIAYVLSIHRKIVLIYPYSVQSMKRAGVWWLGVGLLILIFHCFATVLLLSPVEGTQTHIGTILVFICMLQASITFILLGMRYVGINTNIVAGKPKGRARETVSEFAIEKPIAELPDSSN